MHSQFEDLSAMLLHQKEWIEGPAAYLASTMPGREKQVRILNNLSRTFYGRAIVLAFIGVGAALAGHRFIDSWIGFLVFTEVREKHRPSGR
jgi:hypothetical protein